MIFFAIAIQGLFILPVERFVAIAFFLFHSTYTEILKVADILLSNIYNIFAIKCEDRLRLERSMMLIIY